MKLVHQNVPERRAFPHVIEHRAGRNWRHTVHVANEFDDRARYANYPFVDPGMIDGAGRLTAEGRRVITEGVSKKARRTAIPYCIVWSERDCTFFMRDGSTIDGHEPPEGEPSEPEDYLAQPARLVDCSWIELPERCTADYICIRQLTRDRIEISSGQPMLLGLWDQAPLPGQPNPLRHLFDDEYRLIEPDWFRGLPVTDIEGGRIYGPVQPDGVRSFVVEPWPDQVFEACFKIAGRELPADLRDAVWRAIDPLENDMIRVGALQAA